MFRVGIVFKHHERGVSADLREFPLSYRGVLLRPGLDFVSGVPNDGHHLLRQAYVSTSSSTEQALRNLCSSTVTSLWRTVVPKTDGNFECSHFTRTNTLNRRVTHTTFDRFVFGTF